MNRSEKICWNRLSSFFELPYWKDLHVRHCLNVMHIEKNVCMNILSTLLDIPGKSKDGLNARRDLLFPIAIRLVLPKHVRYAITRLCIVFNSVCNKVLDAQQLDKLEEDVVVTLCLFEKYFPPSFFTIMIHLTVNIVREVKLCGPIYLRWMYPFERFMKVIKNSVRNRYRPEGCIAESYLIEEAIEFCFDFLSRVDPVGLGTRKLQDHLDTSNIGRPLSMGVPFKPEQELLRQAHRYVLENTIDVQPYMEKHMKALQLQYPNKSKNQKWLQEEHNRTFIHWLREKVSTELEVGNSGVSDNLRWIAHGPHPFVITYSGYAINGCRYHTKSFEKDRSVQNSGVSLVAKTIQVSSSKDKNPVIGDMSFYGNSGGVRIDELSYTLVDLNRVGHKSDSFILASQTKQVFYVEDPSDVRWSVVLTPPQRDFEDRYNDDELGDTILRCEGIPNDMPDVYLNNDLDENVSTYVVRYNEDGAPIGENGAKLKSFIGSATHYHVPITYMSWKSVPAELKDKIFTTVAAAFVIDPRSRQNVLQTAGISFRQFKNWLTTKYIIPHKDEPQLLQVPPEKYSFIEQNHWEEFVRSRLSKTFQGMDNFYT
ncbi:hypothetical protein IC582_021302 [Cucumis melo]